MLTLREDNMSLYAQYVMERCGDHSIETEYGFATYRYLNDAIVYIVDIYVVPEERKSNKASAIADEVVRAAKLRGCKKLWGTVCPTANGSTASLKVLLGYGMTLHSSANDCITFEKDI